VGSARLVGSAIGPWDPLGSAEYKKKIG